MSFYVGQQKCKNSKQVYVHKEVENTKVEVPRVTNFLDLICTTMTYNWSEFGEVTI